MSAKIRAASVSAPAAISVRIAASRFTGLPQAAWRASRQAAAVTSSWRSASAAAGTSTGCPIFFIACPDFATIEVSQIFHAVSRNCYTRLVFGEMPVQVVAKHQDEIASQALASARSVASGWLATGPGMGLAPRLITEALLNRDASDPYYSRLAPYEKPWALLVVRLLRGAMDPSAAVDAAHIRGASWADIGGALGIARQTAHNRFGDSARH